MYLAGAWALCSGQVDAKPGAGHPQNTEILTMKTTARRFFATLASTLIVCSSFAIPTAAQAQHGVKCRLVQTAPFTYTTICTRGV